MRMYKWAMLLCAGALMGQVRPATTPTAPTPAKAPAETAANAELATLKQTVAALSKKLGEMENKVKSLETYNTYIVRPSIASFSDLLATEAELDLTAGKFDAITDTSGFGRFLIIVDTVEPYLDGSKVAFRIGNTLSGNFSKLTYNLTWNRRKPENKDDSEALIKWYQTEKTKDFDETATLNKSGWNYITAFLPGTKPDQLGYLAIKNLSLGTINFR